MTAPVLAAEPNALTQSPTARALDVVDWVVLTGVEPDVVMVSFSVLGLACVGFFVFEFDVVAPRPKLVPALSVMPDTVSVDPLTAVTLPDAKSRDASCLRKLLAPDPPPGKLGRDPFDSPPAKPPPPVRAKPPEPPPPGKPPAPVPPTRVPEPTPHEPVDVGDVTVTERAAIVVLDFFDAVPVTVTQSPDVSELTDSVAVLENCVVGVQLTVVCPLVALCTSMLAVLRAATLPVAPIGFEVVAAPAAPAADTTAATATTVVPPAPRSRAQCR